MLARHGLEACRHDPIRSTDARPKPSRAAAMNTGTNWSVRSFRLALALAATSGAFAGTAQAQDYPSQDIRLICGFPPGSGADVLVRYFAEKLRPVARRTVMVENKVGAASNIATEYVARSKPDGHTLYPFAGTTVAASMHLFKNPPVDVGKAIRVAATTSNLAFMLVVDANSPYKTVAELTAAMKQKGEQRQLCRCGQSRQDHGRDLQERRRSRCAGGAISDRTRFPERDAQRQARLRPARPDLCARAAARRSIARPRGQRWPSGYCRCRMCRP